MIKKNQKIKLKLENERKMEKLRIRIKEIQEIKIKLEMKDKMENLKK